MAKSLKDRQRKVLDELKRHGNVSRAARAADLNRRTINNWRMTDKVFGAAAEAAITAGRK